MQECQSMALMTRLWHKSAAGIGHGTLQSGMNVGDELLHQVGSPGGEVKLIGVHLILGYPEPAGEWVGFRLQRGDASVEFGQFDLGFLAGGANYKEDVIPPCVPLPAIIVTPPFVVAKDESCSTCATSPQSINR